MSYTPHTWTDGETITAAKMNAIEDGIEEAAESGGGGGVDAVIWFKNSTVGWQVEGDFNAALAKISSGKPLVAVVYANYAESSTGYSWDFYNNKILGCSWSTQAPDEIFLADSSSTGFTWTANGIIYND